MDADPKGHAYAVGNFHFRGFDRYDALGRGPNGCKGQCEGTGWVPVNRNFAPTWNDKSDEGYALREAWHKAEAEKPSPDGTHFVRCPRCATEAGRDV